MSANTQLTHDRPLATPELPHCVVGLPFREALGVNRCNIFLSSEISTKPSNQVKHSDHKQCTAEGLGNTNSLDWTLVIHAVTHKRSRAKKPKEEGYN